jgi:hypothetical protein
MNSKIVVLANEDKTKICTGFNFAGITENEKIHFKTYDTFKFVIPFTAEFFKDKKRDTYIATNIQVIGYDFNNRSLPFEHNHPKFDAGDMTIKYLSDFALLQTIAVYPNSLDKLFISGIDLDYIIPKIYGRFDKTEKHHVKLDSRFKDCLSLYLDVKAKPIPYNNYPLVTLSSSEVAHRIASDKKYSKLSVDAAKKQARDDINAERRGPDDNERRYELRRMEIVISSEPAYANKVLLGNDKYFFSSSTDLDWSNEYKGATKIKFLAVILDNVSDAVSDMVIHKSNNSGSKDYSAEIHWLDMHKGCKLDDLANYVVEALEETKVLPILKASGIDKDTIKEAVRESAKANDK